MLQGQHQHTADGANPFLYRPPSARKQGAWTRQETLGLLQALRSAQDEFHCGPTAWIREGGAQRKAYLLSLAVLNVPSTEFRLQYHAHPRWNLLLYVAISGDGKWKGFHCPFAMICPEAQAEAERWLGPAAEFLERVEQENSFSAGADRW